MLVTPSSQPDFAASRGLPCVTPAAGSPAWHLVDARSSAAHGSARPSPVHLAPDAPEPAENAAARLVHPALADPAWHTLSGSLRHGAAACPATSMPLSKGHREYHRSSNLLRHHLQVLAVSPRAIPPARQGTRRVSRQLTSATRFCGRPHRIGNPADLGEVPEFVGRGFLLRANHSSNSKFRRMTGLLEQHRQPGPATTSRAGAMEACCTWWGQGRELTDPSTAPRWPRCRSHS